MLPPSLASALPDALAPHLGGEVRIHGAEAVGGGCIHSATHVSASPADFFVKYNAPREAQNFAAEADGLGRLRDAATLHVPRVYATGTTGEHAWIAMEYLPPVPRRVDFFEAFGKALADLHRVTAPEFGLDRDNFIGRLPQPNSFRPDWISFFVECRLEPQLRLAEASGLVNHRLRKAFETFYPRLQELIPEAQPSLLHGDLWSGNYLSGPDGSAALIDPAVYFGHREAEIAFTLLFGGFPPPFYRAYEAAWPMEPRWRERVDVFNLYPLAVHLNLFGRGYLPEIQAILRRYA